MNVLKSQIILLFISLNLFNCAGSSAEGVLNKIIDNKSVDKLIDIKRDQFDNREQKTLQKTKIYLMLKYSLMYTTLVEELLFILVLMNF